MEDSDNRALATLDPKSFMETYPDGAILDEIQRTPNLLSHIQVKVDEKDKKCLFILTGSHQVELHHAISQSLAGRTSILKLLPLSLQEMRHSNIKDPLNEVILKDSLLNNKFSRHNVNPLKYSKIKKKNKLHTSIHSSKRDI